MKNLNIVIVGGGFAGLYAARKLGNKKGISVTLLDKRNFHLFQPLLYQVATGSLSPGDIAAPIRSVLRKYKNVKVLQAKVIDLKADEKKVFVDGGKSFDYDYLIVASGVTHDYFGSESWEKNAPGLKTVEDSLEIRRRILIAFEEAEKEEDLAKREALLTFVIIGAGPTGVELAGAIGELAHKTLKGEYRNIDLSRVKVILLEGGKRVLSTYPEDLSLKAKKNLEKLGVDVRLSCFAQKVEEEGIIYKSGEEEHKVPTRTVLWAAGVRASELGKVISEKTNAELDRVGRIKVETNLSIKNYPEIIVAGDLATLVDISGNLVPGVATAAMQQGAYVAKRILAEQLGKTIDGFKYLNKGSLAVIGKNSAVADVGPFHFSGFFAWLIWALIHIWYLIEFGSKLVVSARWAWNYITTKRGSRLITSAFKTRIERGWDFKNY